MEPSKDQGRLTWKGKEITPRKKKFVFEERLIALKIMKGREKNVQDGESSLNTWKRQIKELR